MEYTEWAPLGRLLAMRAHLGARRDQPFPGPSYIDRAAIEARRRVQREQTGGKA